MTVNAFLSKFNLYRNFFRSTSNNPDNLNKNICTQAVCEYLGVDTVKYLHTRHDTLKAINSKYVTVELLKDFRGQPIGNSINKLCVFSADVFLVAVESHVFLVNKYGKPIVDTCPLVVDTRPMVGIWAILGAKIK